MKRTYKPREAKIKWLLACRIGSSHYLIPSRTEKGVFHALDLSTDECSCKDNQIGKNECWHLKQIKAMSEWAIAQNS